jgi:hypothetical protein
MAQKETEVIKKTKQKIKQIALFLKAGDILKIKMTFKIFKM